MLCQSIFFDILSLHLDNKGAFMNKLNFQDEQNFFFPHKKTSWSVSKKSLKLIKEEDKRESLLDIFKELNKELNSLPKKGFIHIEVKMLKKEIESYILQ